MVVLEIEFRDRFKHPVIAEVYSGLGTTNPFSELHRFGGTANGQWKKVRIPASADFIFRFLDTNSLRFRLRPTSGVLEVREFRLTAPERSDRSRYNQETRAWVRREQQRATIDDRYYRLAQTPVLAGEWAGKPLVPYQRNWMDIIRPISAPQGRETGAPLETRMFLNELEPLQLGIYANGTDLHEVEVTLDPITGPGGAVVVQTTVRVAEYSKVKGQLIPSYLIEPFPQRLWPAYPFDVRAGESHMVWIVLETDTAFSRPGRYESRLRIQARGQEEVQVPVIVEILDERLLTMEEAGLKMGGCTTGLLPEFELEFLHKYNHNMVNIWYASVRPVLSPSGDDSFAMDFRIMDAWMAAARRQGMQDMVYFLGGNPYGFPQTMHLPRTLANTVLGTDDDGWRDVIMQDPGNIPKQVASLMVDWVRRFADHARENEWPNVILTPFDEPAKYTQYRTDLGMLDFIKPQFKKQVALLREGDPTVQIYGSIHQYDPGMDFLEDVDVFCTNAVHENWGMPDEVRNASKILWEYSGTSDRGLPAVARYTYGFYFASHGSRGSLAWAYNWGSRFDTLDGSNWLYAWNTPFEVIPTPYMEGMREAWDDRRLIETVKHRAQEQSEEIGEFLGRLFADIAAARGRGGTDTVNDFWERAREDRQMDEWRNRLIQKLQSLRQSSDR